MNPNPITGLVDWLVETISQAFTRPTLQQRLVRVQDAVHRERVENNPTTKETIKLIEASALAAAAEGRNPKTVDMPSELSLEQQKWLRRRFLKEGVALNFFHLEQKPVVTISW
jgi:hypothetical protein